MTTIALIATTPETRSLFDQLKPCLQDAGSTTIVERHFTTNGNTIRQECTGKDLVVVSIAGSDDEIQTGLDILRHATQLRRPAAVFMDLAGYQYCIRKRVSYPFENVRLIALLQQGNFHYLRGNFVQFSGEIVPHGAVVSDTAKRLHGAVGVSFKSI